MTLDEVAATLEQSRVTVWRKVRAGVIPGGYQLGGERTPLRVDREAFNAWLHSTYDEGEAA